MVADALVAGNLYSADELAGIFGFKPYYLRSAGGIVPVTAKNAILVITHASDDASFEYGDYWDGNDLIYTGRGQSGDQTLTGPNRDIAENRRALFLFEHAGTYQRRYLGRTRCTGYTWGSGPDKDGVSRKIIRFRLALESRDLDGEHRERESVVPQALPLCLCGCGLPVSKAGNRFVQTHDGKLHGRVRRFLAGEDQPAPLTPEQLDWAFDTYPDLAEVGAGPVDEDESGFEEGAFKEHRIRERNKALVKAAKARFKTLHGRLYCTACGFDFAETYGGLGADFIEAHHIKPVSKMQPGETTRIGDLAMVCSNCHRMLHKDGELTVEVLRAKLVSRAKAIG